MKPSAYGRNYNISVMVSRLPKDRTLEMEDRKKTYNPPVPHLLQAQQVLVLLYAKVARTPRHWKLVLLLVRFRQKYVDMGFEKSLYICYKIDSVSFISESVFRHV